jgi:transposase InsO family protein
MRLLVSLLVWTLRAVLKSRRSLALENLALRQQLATCSHAEAALVEASGAGVLGGPFEGLAGLALATRRIVLINVATSPGLGWVKQQLRQAIAWSKSPRFLLHDNDGIFGQFRDRRHRGKKGRRYRCRLDLWLADVMGIEGIPIPYGAPNASPHIERFNRTLREEALNHFIFLNARQILEVCREYADFYNRARPSQALQATPDPYRELTTPPPKTGKLVALPVLGGVQHDHRRAA